MKQCNVVILAGGFGERLWPVSSKDFPKQFMALYDGLSFMQQSLQRAFLLEDCGEIMIVTRKDILETTITQCEEYKKTLSKEDAKRLSEKLIVIAEPCQKHTTPPIMFASRYFEAQGQVDVPMLVLTSDHIIKPQNNFENDVKKAIKEANNGSFMCFAIPPIEASTGFGYMEVDNSAENDVFEIKNFKEKPDLELAKRYLDSGNYWWNSGMFCVMPQVFIQELEAYTPEVFESFPVITDTENFAAKYMGVAYGKTIAISIDHSVAEKSKKVKAIKTIFDWHDIGTWDSFAVQFETDAKENAFFGNIAETNSQNCFVYADSPVVLCGVEDLIVTVKDGKILIAKKGMSQNIKEAVSNL